jgi:hypothetical protein
MGLQLTMNVHYDPNIDIYFINGASSEIFEKMDTGDPIADHLKFMELQGQKFNDLKYLLELLKSFGFQYIIRGKRAADKLIC